MAEGLVRVTLCWSPAPRDVRESVLELPVGACVRDALGQSPGPTVPSMSELVEGDVGVWGRRCALEQVLRDGDRVEVYRPLRVDPKVARRERFTRQGARSAGLFSRRPRTASPPEQR